MWALAGSAAQSDGLARAATLEHVIAPHLLELVQYWTYRLGGFVLVNVLDDPAWLAMIFC